MIKTLLNKIHVQIILVMIFSLGVSVIVFLGLSELNEQLSIKYQQSLIEEQKQNIKDNINEIKYVIDKNDMTFEEVLKSDVFQKYDIYDIYLSSSDGKLYTIDENGGEYFDDINLQSESLYVFNIQYKDGFGVIIMKPNMEAFVSDIYEVLIGIFSVCLFFVLLFILTKDQIKYIKKIHDGIEIMAGGQLSNEIPVEGNNELTNLAVSINGMANSLLSKMDLEKEIDNKQRKLISNISHDLRTPLTSLIGYLDLLSQHKYKDFSVADEYIDIALKKSKRIQGLIEDLFIYTKIVNQDIKFHFEKVDIGLLVGQFTEEVKPNLGTINIETDVVLPNEELLVWVDSNQMLRVFENLFDNIMKYAKENTAVQVSVYESNKKAMVKITNQTDLDLTHSSELLFDRLYVSDENRHNQSSGIGLSIVAEIMKLQGGEVYANFDESFLSIVIELDLLSSALN